MRQVTLVVMAVLQLVAAPAAAQYYQSDFPPEEFQTRWATIYERIGPQAVAVLQGAPPVGGFIVPRQENNFYYLSGVETPNSYLLLDGRTRKATLFLPARDAAQERAEGKVLSAQDTELVRRLVGVDEVRETAAMAGDFIGARPSRGTSSGGAAAGPLIAVYTPFAPGECAGQSRGEAQAANQAVLNDPWDGRLPREGQFVALLRARFPRQEIRDLSPVMDDLRSIKSPRELALLRRAGQLSALGVVEAIRSSKPGVFEYQLDAAARYVFLVNGARLEGYRSITASGVENINNMHYYRNTAPLKEADLVLMDFAPDYHYYTSDIGRMWPVNGTFAPWQRELVGFVLAYHKAVLSRIRPGVPASQIQEEAKQAMEEVFARTRFSKPTYEQAARRLVNTGGGVFSHTVGLAVHDDGKYVGPLRAGQVFAVDPQLRVPEENLYIRYEDTVAVTAAGVEVLTNAAPRELDELEALARDRGIVQKMPPTPPSGPGIE